ncbi:uncharacterized protein K452DRAFT_290353 [Aplosporella prunicola CBS 121167]|uniref:Uncharacterized protein n=1 Tax=Aplosporella prunicola CBS 121167 TaxID=1176127 RepID=A0A6A6B6T3_9PEZI|nr:uncharacterized protein K452DRAFT_290353 [Aplosporella prunicola CBS 121167]KAF2138697.1 hypothetical protein K452DRAFT_290353 [Aplosporella prunicola CBS 121167]
MNAYYGITFCADVSANLVSSTVTVSTTLTLVTPAIDATSSLLLTTTVPTSTSSSLAGEANAAVVMPAPMPVLADAFPAQAAAQASAAAPAAAPEPANPATLTMSTTVSTINPTFSLSLSTLWVPVTLADGATMWVQSTFTQSFAAVPDQGPPPGSGRIGLGSLTVTMRGDGEQAAAVAMGARVGWRGAVVAVGIVGAAMQ